MLCKQETSCRLPKDIDFRSIGIKLKSFRGRFRESYPKNEQPLIQLRNVAAMDTTMLGEKNYVVDNKTTEDSQDCIWSAGLCLTDDHQIFDWNIQPRDQKEGVSKHMPIEVFVGDIQSWDEE